jgi:outer membrane protein OmpA-like peptidoglycan-associated protein
MKKKLTLPLAVLALGLAAPIAMGCKGEVKVGTPEVKAPEPPPPPPPPPPEPPKEAAKPPPIQAVGKAKIEGDKINIPGQIEFDVDKATIRDTPQTKEILNTLNDVLKQNPSVTKLRIEGHTDNTGSKEHNQKLSQARAEAVMKWLTDHGTDKARLEAVGYGDTKPDFPNDTPENKQKNRRTEFHITVLDGKPFKDAGAAGDPPPQQTGDNKTPPAAGTGTAKTAPSAQPPKK